MSNENENENEKFIEGDWPRVRLRLFWNLEAIHVCLNKIYFYKDVDKGPNLTMKFHKYPKIILFT